MPLDHRDGNFLDIGGAAHIFDRGLVGWSDAQGHRCGKATGIR
jgi:hypothetical protein